MTEIEFTILRALRHYGRTKDFLEILEEVGVASDSSTRLEVTSALETQGLIQNVQYGLPFTIRADLSPKGLEIVSSEPE